MKHHKFITIIHRKASSTLRHTYQKKAEKQNSENDQHSVLQQTHSRKDPSLRCGTLSRRRQKSKIPKMGCIPCFNRNTAAKTLCCAAAAKKEEEEEEEEEQEEEEGKKVPQFYISQLPINPPLRLLLVLISISIHRSILSACGLKVVRAWRVVGQGDSPADPCQNLARSTQIYPDPARTVS